ncbi:MAG: ATP-binding protein [bacterium]|nr:ATP-binding protein [bacterium]
MRNQYQITRSAELESLAVFRDFIEKACKKNPRADDRNCYDLKLAVDEACTNIITHGYAEMNPGSIILSLEMKPNKVVVTITDFGHPFEPSEASAPDVAVGLDDMRLGGFGIFFIYQTMDEINYETTEDGNRLTFIKKLSTQSAIK